MHAEEIKAAMRMKGITPTALADALGVANSSVSQVISGRSTSARIAQRISEIIGKPVDMIWPTKMKSTLRRVKAMSTGVLPSSHEILAKKLVASERREQARRDGERRAEVPA